MTESSSLTEKENNDYNESNIKQEAAKDRGFSPVIFIAGFTGGVSVIIPAIFAGVASFIAAVTVGAVSAGFWMLSAFELGKAKEANKREDKQLSKLESKVQILEEKEAVAAQQNRNNKTEPEKGLSTEDKVQLSSQKSANSDLKNWVAKLDEDRQQPLSVAK